MTAQVFRKKPQDFSPVVEAAGCYIEHEGEYLFLQSGKQKAEAYAWSIPGGKHEEGETPSEAVQREVKEETGITLNPKNLAFVVTLYIRLPAVDFTFHIFSEKLNVRPPVALSSEHEDYRWSTFKEIEKLPLMMGAKEVYLEAISRM